MAQSSLNSFEPQSVEQRIVTVRAAPLHESRAMTYAAGICARSAAAKALSMQLVVIPPGGRADPHRHDGFETAIYLLEGRVETRFGAGLRNSVINEPGDFIYIPSGLPHQPINLSHTHKAIALVSRNNAEQEETVVPYDPASET